MHEVAGDEVLHHQLHLPAADPHEFIVGHDALGLLSGLQPLDCHQSCLLQGVLLFLDLMEWLDLECFEPTTEIAFRLFPERPAVMQGNIESLR